MSVNSKMTAIADEIRELSGTAEIMGLDAMADNLNEANIDVGTEADLIVQIAEALDGKASGGNGSGGNTQTTIITLSIDAPAAEGVESIYYVSPSGLEVIYLMELSLGDTFINCIVPSIISSSTEFISSSGEISELYRISGACSYYVTGPGTLHYG